MKHFPGMLATTLYSEATPQVFYAPPMEEMSVFAGLPHYTWLTTGFVLVGGVRQDRVPVGLRILTSFREWVVMRGYTPTGNGSFCGVYTHLYA